ncbi:MAG: type IV secretory system conjugative DNA transfer family protein [Bdellovibrionales bacterium]|nr:type IV secretory system conjugative DNA transfer family protein [Bdellovibrionales bacterium]
MGYISEDRKTFRIGFPRTPYSTADAIIETHFRMTMSHQWSEASQNILDSRPDPYALEIYYSNGVLQFGFTARGHNIAAISAIVHQIYPEAHIEEIPDHFTDLPQTSHVAVANMTYRRWNIFPVQSYRAISADPMAPFMNSLVELPSNVRVVFQMTSRTHYSVKETYFGFEFKTWLHKLRTLFRPKAWLKREIWKNEATGIDQKVRGNLMWSNIIIAAVLDDPDQQVSPKAAEAELGRHIQTLVTSYNILKKVDWNWFIVSNLRYGHDQLKRLWARKTGKRRPNMQMSMNEQAAIWHLPRKGEIIKFYSVPARKWPPPPKLPDLNQKEEVSVIGETLWRGHSYPFGIHREDRRRHLLITGRGGTGKSPMLRTLIRSDIDNGYGCGLLAPTAELFQAILQLVPAHRVKDVVIIDPTDIDYPASLNPFDLIEEKTRMQVASGMIELFRRRFPKMWSAEVELLMLYCVLTLLSTKFTTVLSIKRMILNEEYRESLVETLEDRNVQNFWRATFPSLRDEMADSVIKPLIRIVDEFTSSDMLYHCLGQPFNTFNFREIIDGGKILLVKVPSKELGEANAAVLGGMVISRIFQAAMSRTDTPYEKRKDFYFYIDEFEEFATESFEEILSESRKYGLNLTLSTQALNQLPPEVKGTVFTNVVNLISFAVTNEDAPILEAEFSPLVKKLDLLGLAPGEFYVKMSVQSSAQPLFSGRLLPRDEEDRGYADEALQSSRERYCVPREKAVEIIKEWGSFG